jgi:hypothetical protein
VQRDSGVEGLDPVLDPDQAAAAAEGGARWELSMRQIETSRTIVFTAPRHARGFFEGLIPDNLDIGRPDQIELIFTGKNERRGQPRHHPLTFKTSVVTRGVEVTEIMSEAITAGQQPSLESWHPPGRSTRSRPSSTGA